MKIIDKINNCVAEDKIFFSFEYFPPKTNEGVEELFNRLDRMAMTGPLFIDITWGAGGSTAGLTLDIATNAQNLIGLETQIHMTCTNQNKDDIEKAIATARKNGIQNILALRGDPPKGAEKWTQTDGGFKYAKDLVKFIREKHGDYFGICVAGYPEGHPDGDYWKDLQHLKEKIEAGADFVITQLFYDCDQFLKFVKDAREIGITCPIIPGIMPIHTYSGFRRMTQFCKTYIPDSIEQDLKKIKTDDDAEVRAYGVKLCITMCRYLLNNGVRGLHFYTLNLEKSVHQILEGLKLIPEGIHRPLPWKNKPHIKRESEQVRPIFWSNRPISYLARTVSWDEFPNGRWGDHRSPAFGDLSDYHLLGIYNVSESKRRKYWGESHDSLESIYNVFVQFLEGKIPQIPWYQGKIELETLILKDDLIKLCKNGFLTINSQPRVNGAPSSDKAVGWGEVDGYVYQKAYVEFFTSPENYEVLKKHMKKYPLLTYHAVNMKGVSETNAKGPTTAVTWGVFPGREIIQPTVVSTEAFLIWKDEAFGLLKSKWADIYPEDSTARKLLTFMADNYYLVHVVDNDYINGDIFKVFDDAIQELSAK